MPKRKLDDKKLEEFVSFMMEKGSFMNKEYYMNGRNELMKEFNISSTTIRTYIKKSIKYGLLSKEKHSEWIGDSGLRVLKIKHEKYGLVLFSQMMFDAREKGIGSDPDKIVSAAKKGGMATQNGHSHVQENLKKAVPYGKGECFYGEIKFDSKGERLIGLVLQEYGLLKLDSGINTQKNFGRKKADFYINDKLVLEYHPFPKAHSEILEETEQEYLKRRQEELKPEFDGKIVLLSSPTAYKFFEKIWDLGILDTYKGVVKTFKKVKEELKRHDDFMKDDYEVDKPLEEDII